MPDTLEQISYEVFHYSHDMLIWKILCIPNSSRSLDKVLKKEQIKYLEDYLSNEEVDCQTVLMEHPYIDRDYMEDYAFYYSRCFKPVERKTTRFHFFSINFDQTKWEEIVKNPEHGDLEEFKDKYLGFLVIKPLPETFIGRTCIRNYAGKRGDGETVNRTFPIGCKYSISICGIPFEIDTVAFQEQDHQVSACATAALWSAFHAAHRVFHNQRPTPAQITSLATDGLAAENRVFPSRGLQLSQMCNAVRRINLEPEVFLPHKIDIDLYGSGFFKAAAYAYMSMGIPVIIGMQIKGNKNLHAETITGFRFAPPESEEETKEEGNNPPNEYVRLRAHQIEKFFVNDDQIGFHARLKFNDEERTNFYFLKSPWKYKNGDLKPAWPRFLLVPVYHKIRLNYEEVYRQVEAYEKYFIPKEVIIGDKAIPIRQTKTTYWDIKLVRVNDFKEYIYKKSITDFLYDIDYYQHINPQKYRAYRELKEKERVAVLKADLPRFLWRCIWHFEGKPAFEFLVDATGSANSETNCRFIFYQEQGAKILLKQYETNYEGLDLRFNRKCIETIVKRGQVSFDINNKY